MSIKEQKGQVVHSTYFDTTTIAPRASNGEHRDLIGGFWGELGSLQLDFLRSNGMKPESRLLDIGCGSLRLGVRAVEYLDAGNYWGTDINDSLMRAGYDKEIVPAGLAPKLPKSNLVVDSDFQFAGIPREFDFVIAQSVFTHLPLNHLRLCLDRLAEHIIGPCTFFLTIFIAPEGALSQPLEQCPGIVTYPHRDPYHYLVADLQHVVDGLPWTVEYVGDWNHPRNQKMVAFKKDERTSVRSSIANPPSLR